MNYHLIGLLLCGSVYASESYYLTGDQITQGNIVGSNSQIIFTDLAYWEMFVEIDDNQLRINELNVVASFDNGAIRFESESSAWLELPTDGSTVSVPPFHFDRLLMLDGNHLIEFELQLPHWPIRTLTVQSGPGGTELIGDRTGVQLDEQTGEVLFSGYDDGDPPSPNWLYSFLTIPEVVKVQGHYTIGEHALGSPLLPGDANLDGIFGPDDLLQVISLGRYLDSTDRNCTEGVCSFSGWSQGDWNDDGRFDVDDLLLAASTGAYNRPRAATVPEPATITLVLIATVFAWMRCRR